MLKVSKLVTYHGKIQVLRRISFEVAQGELIAIIGPNGAGKSTLLGTLSGIYQPNSGAVIIDGVKTEKYTPELMVKKGINLVPERRQVFSSLSVIDNLLLGAYHRYYKDKSNIYRDVEEILQMFPALKGKEKHMAGTLSGGLQQMVAIARGLMAKPKVLMLDEPSVGLAPMMVKEIMQILNTLKKQKTTIVLVEQNAKAALKVADRAYVMDRGDMVIEGTAEELMKDPRIEDAYLGKGYRMPFNPIPL